MNKIILLLMITISFSAMANEKGNGGDVIDLRTYYDRALDEKDLDELFAHNAKKLKIGLIIPMFKYANEDLIEEENARSSFLKIVKDRKQLYEDVVFSIFEFGTCPDRRDACVEEEAPFSRIVFNKKNLLAKATSLGDLGGLVAHEYEHKYAPLNVEHDNYFLGKFFKQRIEAQKHVGQVFSFKPKDNGELPIWHKLPELNKSVLLTLEERTNRTIARNLCFLQGYSEVLDYTVKHVGLHSGSDWNIGKTDSKIPWFTLRTTDFFGEPIIRSGIGRISRSYHFFTKIVCIN
jgi:hypothetical protein